MNNNNNNQSGGNKGLIIGLIIFFILIVIAIIIFLMLRKKKTSSGASTPKTTTPPIVSTPTQQNDPYTVLGMSAYYEPSSFSQEKGWKDTSPGNNDITPENTRGVLNVSENFIYGGVNDGFKIPTSVMDQKTGNYTLFYVGKYNGTNRNRIITDIESDWYSGFNQDKIGVTSSNVSSNNNNANTEWILVTDQPGRFRINGKEIIVPNITVSDTSNVSSNVSDTPKLTQITVNYGGDSNLYSDWAFKDIIIYSKICDKREINIVEKYLEQKHVLEFNKLYGLPENADMKDVTKPGENDSLQGCTASALMDTADAFAFVDGPTKKCLLYNSTDVLKKWSGDRSNISTITSCADATKSVYSGCVDATHGFEPIL